MKNYDLETITPEEIDKEVKKEFKKPHVKRAFSQLNREFNKLDLTDFKEDINEIFK